MYKMTFSQSQLQFLCAQSAPNCTIWRLALQFLGWGGETQEASSPEMPIFDSTPVVFQHKRMH